MEESEYEVPLVEIVSLLLLLLLAGATAFAQTFTGALRGAVRDANGVIPGVTVELINEATNVGREAVSNEEGLYNFAAVPPGVYTVKASLTGFKTYEQKGVRVGAQQFVTIDVTLEVGALQETITVTGEAPLIDTSTASTGAVISTEQLNTLPSGGRSAFLFAVTVPTVVASGDSQFNRQQDQTNASLLSLGGGTRRGNNYLIDGVPVTDLRNRASANPTIEALEDVAVQVHTYDAETGRTGGGIFNTATKSGGNSFARQRLLPDASALGHGQQLLLGTGGHAAARRPTSTWAAAASAARSSGTGRSSGSRWKATARTRPATARSASRPRASATATSRSRAMRPAARS